MSLQQWRADREVAKNTILYLRDKITRANDGRGREFTDTERSEWEKANKDFDTLQAKIDAVENPVFDERSGFSLGDPDGRERPKPGMEDTGFGRSRRGRSPEGAEHVRATALQGWLRAGRAGPGMTDQQAEACRRARVNPDNGILDFRLLGAAEYRDLSVGASSGALGGKTVPTGFVYSLERSMLAFGNVRGVATVIRTDGGNSLPWPTVDDTANKGEVNTEAGAVASDENPTFAQVTFSAYKFDSKILKVSSELLQDSAFNLAEVVGSMLGERLSRNQNGYFTTGTGSSQCQGIVTGSSTGKTTASATAITFDEIIDLEHSVDPAYRADPSCGFMCHDNVLAYLRKLKDGSGDYLWEPSNQRGAPGTLHGHPVYVNQQMASAITTGQKTLLFGALRKFAIRDAGTVRLVRLDERYMDNDQVAFIAFLRSDSHVLDAGTDPLKLLVQL